MVTQGERKAMRRRAGHVLVLAVAAFALTGCAGVRNNIHNAAADATDILRFDVSLSLGTDMGAHFMVTKWLQLKSYSYEGVCRIGIGARHMGAWREERQDWWIGPWHSDKVYIKSRYDAMLEDELQAKRKGAGRWPLSALPGAYRTSCARSASALFFPCSTILSPP